MGISSLLPNTQKSTCSSLPSLPLSPLLPLPALMPLPHTAHPQPTLMCPHYTTTPTPLPMTTLKPTLPPQNREMVMLPQDLTELTFPTVVSKLSPTPLTKTDMSLMFNTRVLPNTPNTSPPPLTNPPIRLSGFFLPP